ncbi:MAG: hypothetical protein U0797_21240 [Gemmataceae bacterium]
MPTTCLHCDAALSRRELTDGWCDNCGKKLPSRFAQKTNREAGGKPAAPPASNAISAGTYLLAGAMGIALLYFLVTALLGDSGGAAFFVKFGLRLGVFAAIAVPVALFRAAFTR